MEIGYGVSITHLWPRTTIAGSELASHYRAPALCSACHASDLVLHTFAQSFDVDEKKCWSVEYRYRPD